MLLLASLCTSKNSTPLKSWNIGFVTEIALEIPRKLKISSNPETLNSTARGTLANILELLWLRGPTFPWPMACFPKHVPEDRCYKEDRTNPVGQGSQFSQPSHGGDRTGQHNSHFPLCKYYNWSYYSTFSQPTMRVGCSRDLGSCLGTKRAEIFKEAGILYAIFISKMALTIKRGPYLGFWEKPLKIPTTWLAQMGTSDNENLASCQSGTMQSVLPSCLCTKA